MQPPDIEQHAGQRQQQGNAEKRRMRVYEQWQGNERFFCRGYLVGGPNWKASLGTAALVVMPAGIYIAFVGVYLAQEVHAIILVISCILPVLSTLFLMMTACRDPGIIPRQEPDQEYLSGQKPRTKEVFVNNQRVVIRYNDTCHFYQPPRAHHCSVNDNCIERFDHHCPWVGTTIGLRNYRTFLLFVYTTTVLCLYVFGTCLAQLFVKHDQLVDEARAAGKDSGDLWGETLAKCIPALVLMAYTFLFFWFVGGLSVFHAYLVGTNQTTYENFRYNHDSRPNPYSRGLLRNCGEVWLMSMPPPKVHFRAYVDEVVVVSGQPASPYLDAVQMASLHGNGSGGASQQAAAAAAQGQQGGSDSTGGGTSSYSAYHSAYNASAGGAAVSPIDIGGGGYGAGAGGGMLPVSSGSYAGGGGGGLGNGGGGNAHYYAVSQQQQQQQQPPLQHGGSGGLYKYSAHHQQQQQQHWQHPAPDPTLLSPGSGGAAAAAAYEADLQYATTGREDSMPPQHEPPAHVRNGTFSNQHSMVGGGGASAGSSLYAAPDGGGYGPGSGGDGVQPQPPLSPSQLHLQPHGRD